MKALKDILFRVSIDAVQGELDRPVVAIAFDSRKVVPQGMFVAQAGENFDGHRFIDQAIKTGATTVVCEVLPELMQADAYVVLGTVDWPWVRWLPTFMMLQAQSFGWLASPEPTEKPP